MQMDDKMTLLIVDDDSDDRMFFRDAVKEINPGYELLEACDGEEALNLLRKAVKLPDFIFLDLNMPYMNGRECLKELKADTTLKRIPVIIYSTTSFQEEIDGTKKLGAAHFLTKIADVKRLPSVLIGAMERAVGSMLIY